MIHIVLSTRMRGRIVISLTAMLGGCCPILRPCPPKVTPGSDPELLTRVADEVLREQRQIALIAGCDSTQLDVWRRAESRNLSPAVRHVIREEVAARARQTTALCADPSESMAPTRAERAQADSLRRTQQIYAAHVAQLDAPLPDVYFDFASARIRDTDTTAIRLVAEALLHRPEMDLLLTGYTDEAGPPDINIALASARLESVRKVLAERYGVPSDRLVMTVFGEARELQIHPRAVRHEPGAELNRRVSFVLLPRDTEGTQP